MALNDPKCLFNRATTKCIAEWEADAPFALYSWVSWLWHCCWCCES